MSKRQAAVWRHLGPLPPVLGNPFPFELLSLPSMTIGDVKWVCGYRAKGFYPLSLPRQVQWAQA